MQPSDVVADSTVMKKVRPPKRRSYYPDRDLDCQEAIEAGIQLIMENVAAAGWGPTEITEAIEQLAMVDRMARKENAEVDAAYAIEAKRP